ncbi:hypothetical protein F2P81_001561 [Scophthalmus maximus]|uniref:Uncharacterized protein n=1 Tax=Scophthalmus maximus TaxID=52904 RepID=A0A6A4TSK0_SCOMX|nr:hypothetical protein F2P81_001561 [Scophthalmus maximus]
MDVDSVTYMNDIFHLKNNGSSENSPNFVQTSRLLGSRRCAFVARTTARFAPFILMCRMFRPASEMERHGGTSASALRFLNFVDKIALCICIQQTKLPVEGPVCDQQGAAEVMLQSVKLRFPTVVLVPPGGAFAIG